MEYNPAPGTYSEAGWKLPPTSASGVTGVSPNPGSPRFICELGIPVFLPLLEVFNESTCISPVGDILTCLNQMVIK